MNVHNAMRDDAFWRWLLKLAVELVVVIRNELLICYYSPPSTARVDLLY